MSEEELIETLKEFEKNRVEKLKEPSKNLFYAIMKIADERDKYKEEVNKLTAESTEWEERTYCWQDRAENLQIVLDKIKEILKEPDKDGFDEDGYDDSYYDMIYTNRIKELLEEIK